jgi:CSLREA domain-containing protein/uncharacterized repeat protein (TIGR01451 family)
MRTTGRLLASLTLGLGLTLLLLSLLAWPIRAAGFSVTKFTDGNDGTCDTDCSLREAIIAANASGTDDIITLGVGTYTLSITGTGEDLSATGDLDITAANALTITGQGSDQTIIDAAGIDRVLHILNGTVVISGVTVRGGSITGFSDADGGGIFNEGRLHLQSSVVTGNKSDQYGGGIANGSLFSTGNLTIIQSSIYSNTGDTGGGIANGKVGSPSDTGNLSVTQSSIYSNAADNNGGGIFNHGSLTLTQSNIYSGTAGFGGGIYNSYGSVFVMQCGIFGNSGGGIYISRGSVTVTQCSIHNNSGSGVRNYSKASVQQSNVYSNMTTFNGGGIDNASGGALAVVSQSNIFNNIANIHGGGISNFGSLTITQSSIFGNSANSAGGGITNLLSGDLDIIGSSIYSNAASGGGGIDNEGNLFLTGSNIYSNSAVYDGGGIDNGGSLIMIGSSIYRNTVDDDGGGIANSFSSLNVIESSIYSNTASNRGGGILNYRGSVTMTESSVYRNIAVENGGGIFNFGTALLNNSTISRNHATTGAGLYGDYNLNFGPLSLLNSTVALNEGEGLYINDFAVTTTLQNTLFTGNTGDACAGTGVLVSLGHNLSSDDTCNLVATGDQPNTDPLLQPLADNGGPTIGVDGQPLLTHAILPDSPAVDTADNTACPATDQRGIARPQGPGCDIGAFEVAPEPVLYIRKTAPVTVTSGSPITFVVVVTNRGNLTTTNLLITDVIPANAAFISSDGLRVGNVVSWTYPSLAPHASLTRTFTVTGTESVVNSDYRVTSDEVSATRNEAVVTVVPQFGIGTAAFRSLQELALDNSRAVAVGDLNKDGFPDAFVANASPNVLYLNNGEGRFFSSGQNPGSDTAQAVALGDFDDDGDLDAFVGNDDGQANRVWLNDGQGRFSTIDAPVLGNSDAQAVALGDFNGDGWLDALLGTGAGEGNQVWLNDGEGSLVLTETLSLGNSQAVALGDFNDDELPDAVSANGSGENNQIWLNDGDGTFYPGPTLPGTQDSQAVVVGHLNNDSEPDVVIGNGGGAPNQVWLNQGNGVFNTSPDFNLGNRDTQGLALGDVNLDGTLDLLVANGSGQPNEIWLNDGFGNFGAAPALTFDSRDSNAIVTADFDLDGDLDIFVANGEKDDDQPNAVYDNPNAQQQITIGPFRLTFGVPFTLTVDIPAGTLSQPTPFTYTPRIGPTQDYSNTLRYANRAFNLNAEEVYTLSPAITLSVYYPADTEVNTNTLRLYYRDTDQSPAVWKDVAATCVPTSTYRYEPEFVEVAICHLTEFSLFNLLTGSNVFLPVTLKE